MAQCAALSAETSQKLLELRFEEVGAIVGGGEGEIRTLVRHRTRLEFRLLEPVGVFDHRFGEADHLVEVEAPLPFRGRLRHPAPS